MIANQRNRMAGRLGNSGNITQKARQQPQKAKKGGQQGQLSKAVETRLKNLEDLVIFAVLWSGEGSAMNMAEKDKNERFDSLRERMVDPERRQTLLAKLYAKAEAVTKPNPELTEQEKIMANMERELTESRKRESDRDVVMSSLLRELTDFKTCALTNQLQGIALQNHINHNATEEPPNLMIDTEDRPQAEEDDILNDTIDEEPEVDPLSDL